MTPASSRRITAKSCGVIEFGYSRNLSFSMLLRYSFSMGEEADLIETAVQSVLSGGTRTADIMAPGMTKVSTQGMMDTLLQELDKQSS